MFPPMHVEVFRGEVLVYCCLQLHKELKVDLWMARGREGWIDGYVIKYNKMLVVESRKRYIYICVCVPYNTISTLLYV